MKKKRLYALTGNVLVLFLILKQKKIFKASVMFAKRKVPQEFFFFFVRTVKMHL